MLGEFAQDSDFVVWSLGIADLGTEGTSERDGAKVKNCIDVGLKNISHWIRPNILDFEIWRYPEITCKIHVF